MEVSLQLSDLNKSSRSLILTGDSLQCAPQPPTISGTNRGSPYSFRPCSIKCSRQTFHHVERQAEQLLLLAVPRKRSTNGQLWRIFPAVHAQAFGLRVGRGLHLDGNDADGVLDQKIHLSASPRIHPIGNRRVRHRRRKHVADTLFGDGTLELRVPRACKK